MTQTNKTCYLAGPIGGQSYGSATTWRAEATAGLAALGVRAIDPMRGKGHLSGEASIDAGVYSQPLSTPSAVVARDRNDVARAGCVLVNLLGAERISIGTMIELGMADAHRVPVVLVMEPSGNVHDHLFLRVLAAVHVSTLEEAFPIVASILNFG